MIHILKSIKIMSILSVFVCREYKLILWRLALFYINSNFTASHHVRPDVGGKAGLRNLEF
jgi:hypothetical protein